MERDSNNSPCVGQRGGVEPDRLVAHAGGAVGLGPAAVPVARPERLAVGQARASSVACQSLSGVTSRGVTGRIFVATVSRGLCPKIRRFIQRLMRRVA